MGGPGSGGRRSNPGGRPRKSNDKIGARTPDDFKARLLKWGEARGLNLTEALIAASERGMRCTEE
jgi:hypothetical protein